MISNQLFEQINKNVLENYENQIYHYTSEHSFQEIIKSNSLIFKEISNFEDKEEFYYTIKILKKVIYKFYNEYNNNPNKIKFLTNLLQNDLKVLINNRTEHEKDRLITYRYYVVCFSTDKSRDKKYMWTHFTKNSKHKGFCLNFTQNLFINNLESNKDYVESIFSSKVSYKKYKLKKKLETLLLCYIEMNTKYDILEFYDILRFIAIFNKRKIFKRENEYRFVIIREIHNKIMETNESIKINFYKEALHSVCCSPTTRIDNDYFYNLMKKSNYPLYIELKHSDVIL